MIARIIGYPMKNTAEVCALVAEPDVGDIDR
jgi:hypothetical protein